MSRSRTLRSTATATVALVAAFAAAQSNRPPAVPLVTHDPYFSLWSFNDRLNEGPTRHWTGTPQTLTSLIRVDGKTFSLMGARRTSVPSMTQKSVQVLPTRTVYTFEGAGVLVMMTFTTPTLPDDLDLLSRPATYVTWAVDSVDGRPHQSSVYFDAGAELAVNQAGDAVNWDSRRSGGLDVLRISAQDQRVLGRSGDNLRIEWGHLYLAAPSQKTASAIGPRDSMIGAFTADGKLPAARDTRMPRAANDNHPVAAVALDLGVSHRATASGHAILAYDDEYSITYFRRKLRPYWRRKGMDAMGMLRAAERDYNKVRARCDAFDRELLGDLHRLGGSDYAYIGSLAYRQSFAAQKVVADAKGQPLMFSKENFSNGCIGTVDVLYPAAPALLVFSPTLMKASLVPILDYAASSRWKFPFAPHDLGTYPLANGQVYGGGELTEENQMPVEESGNMLIMLAALAKYEGNADFSARYWPQLSKWAQYLADKGFDPESQLSTDDFAGHLAHNVNLSAKAIEALGAYAYLADLRGLKAESAKYRALARSFADRWVREARDGDHYKLAFDKPGTWSQKYNLVWDRLLGFNLFPASVLRTEVDYYRGRQNAYGLPLDSRRDYTKLDWIVWTATLTGNRNDFDALVAPITKFLDASPSRVPMTDWYSTASARQEGFQARSVVGGVFIKMMDDAAVWRKYASRDRNRAGGWAAIPPPVQITEIVPTARTAAAEWSYTTERPAEGWFQPTFGASGWRRGKGGFGTAGTPSAFIGTEWNGREIWVRREFDLPTGKLDDLQLYIHHDEDADVYVNGVLAARLPGYTATYETVPLSPAARATLKPGRNTIAIYVRQSNGGQYIDAGLVRVKE